MTQQYRRHVQNALAALDTQRTDRDIARRQVRMAIEAYKRNAQLKGQDTKKPSAPQSSEGFSDGTTTSHVSSNGSNAMPVGQPIKHLQFAKLNRTQQRVIFVLVTAYVLMLGYVVWSNMLLASDLGYGTDDQWLMVAAEFSQSLFMVAGLHWWLGAKEHEFPIAVGIAVFSLWLLADRLVIAGHYHRAIDQLKAAKDATVQHVMGVI